MHEFHRMFHGVMELIFAHAEEEKSSSLKNFLSEAACPVFYDGFRLQVMKKMRASPPATSADMRDIRSHLKVIQKELKKKAAQADLQELEKRMMEGVRVLNENLSEQLRKDIRRDVSADVRVLNENLLHDFQGAFKDRTEQLRDRIGNHEDRLQRLESRMTA